MTEISKAAQQALDALIYHVEQTRPIERTTQAITALRAALQDKAVEPVARVDYSQRGNIAWLFGKQLADGTELFDRPASVVPDDHPLMIFAKECEIGTYMEHEVPMAARKAIAASQQKGGSAG